MNKGEPSSLIPLCVDLDGTLIKTDTLVESFLLLVKRNPLFLLALPLWFLKGKAYAKHRIAQIVTPDVSFLPYYPKFVKFLERERGKSRRLILVTAADKVIATQVANHLGLFSKVLASNGDLNLKGKEKLKLLKQEFGIGKFDYAGDSPSDQQVWEHANRAIIVNPSKWFLWRLRKKDIQIDVFQEDRGVIKNFFREIRVYQWAKNLILFIPLIMAHKFREMPLWANATLAFLSFSLGASGGYILNDLLDLEADRHHPEKRNRPFASGALPLSFGIFLVPFFLILSIGIATSLPRKFIEILLLYFFCTFGYSLYFKRLVLLDVIVLAFLYTIRFFAGGVAVGVQISSWLLAFSTFFFISLALVKRYSESRISLEQEKESVKGRGYLAQDLEHLGVFGIASGTVAVLILALYVNSPEIIALYTKPKILWLFCPLFFYWIGRIWILTYRGEVHDDPVLFAMKDKPTYVVILLIAALILTAL